MAKKKEEVKNEPNIVFTGKRKVMGRGGKFEMVEKEIPESISVPSGEIVLHKDVKHGEPFYHADANILLANSKDFESPAGTGE